MVTLVNIMVMNGWPISLSFHVNRPSHSWVKAISDSDLETPRSGSSVWSKARSYSRSSILLIHFIFTSHQSHQQFLRYSYFEIWPWNIHGQGHEWGQRSRPHIIPSIQPMHFLFVSHPSDQPFLRYAQNTGSVWSWKTHPNFLKKICPKNYPKSNQVITMTRAIKLPSFVVIGWVVLTLSRRQANFC